MKYRIGDVKEILQNKDFDVFVHGCNLKGFFNAGIAGVVRSVYPECAEVYEKGVESGEYEGGQMIPYEIEKFTGVGFGGDTSGTNKIILNAFTQIHPGPDGSYDLVDKVFETIGRVYDCKISFPLISAGIAGLNWNVVKEIIDYRLKGKDYECIVRMEDVIKYELLNN